MTLQIPQEAERLVRLVASKTGKTPDAVLKEAIEADSYERQGFATESPLRDTPYYDVFFNYVGQALATARKGDRLPEECGMRPRHAPVAPHATQSLIVSAGPVDPAWHPYLSNLEAVSAR